MEMLAPLQRGFHSGVMGIQNVARNYIFLRHLREENETLKKALVELERKNTELTEAAIANERLRKFLDFKEKMKKPMLPAELVGEDASSWFRTITIDKGSIDGVRKGMVVVAADGLVGHIIKTSRNYSKVLLITDYNSSVDAICQNSRARGIVQGKVEDCDLKYVSRREELSRGERVITSGLGGRFPKGLVIGTVTRVDKNSYGFFQKVEVTPAVDFTKLEEVFVILETNSLFDQESIREARS
jgi:rod shape-determining protein MreC